MLLFFSLDFVPFLITVGMSSNIYGMENIRQTQKKFLLNLGSIPLVDGSFEMEFSSSCILLET